MKKLLIILTLLFTLSAFAQTANPEAIYLNDGQVKRLIERIKAIEEATNAQTLEIYKFRDELGATTKDGYGELERFPDGKFGFKKKVVAAK